MRAEVSLLTVVLVIISYLPRGSEQSNFEDERCICACPKNLLPNGIGPIFIKMKPPNGCLCEYVVPPVKINISNRLDICHFCECKYEIRNSTTIKVVVIFIICVVLLLVIYMLFLMCLDPLIQQRRPSYERHVDDDVSVNNMASLQGISRDATTNTRTAAALGRQHSLLNRITTEQQKWKGIVREQRRNIYDAHSMLS